MALRVLIAPDKFKGTLTAHAAAEAIARGWRQARPDDALTLLPITDGGDGFGEVMGQLLGAKGKITRTVDAAHRPCRVRWWWSAKTKTAIIESAEVIGLAKHKGFHPFDLDTYGLGGMLRAAAAAGAKRCLVGIGGSATNDGGFGLARALGWKFRDARDREITRWTNLRDLAELVRPCGGPEFEKLIVAVDVQNPLLGARGATRVYGPQKGLKSRDFPLAEQCLKKLLKFGLGPQKPGDGAAGGLGFGLRNFAHAKLLPGFDLFAREAGLERELRKADLVITGEGAIDRSTFMGKGVGEIARLCRQIKIPCIGLAGIIKTRGKFAQGYALTELTTEGNAKQNAAHWLERLAARVAADVTRRSLRTA